MGSRKPEKILVETSPIELCVQAASSHYPLFNWCQQFMSQRHARNTDAETFVLFHIWVPRSLAVGTGKPTSKAIDFRQIQAIARSLVVHTWRSSRKIWKLAQGIYTLGQDPSSGKGSLRQVILDRRADLVRTAIGCSFAPKNCILMAWFSAMLSSWCDLDVTGQGNRFFRT